MHSALITLNTVCDLYNLGLLQVSKWNLELLIFNLFAPKRVFLNPFSNNPMFWTLKNPLTVRFFVTTETHFILRVSMDHCMPIALAN